MAESEYDWPCLSITVVICTNNGCHAHLDCMMRIARERMDGGLLLYICSYLAMMKLYRAEILHVLIKK